MSPVSSGYPYRMHTLDLDPMAPLGGTTGHAISIPFFFDKGSGEWLSAHQQVITFGANSLAYQGGLRVVNAVTTGSLKPNRGVCVPMDGKIVHYSLVNQNGATPDQSVLITSEGTTLIATDMVAGAIYRTADVNFDQGTLAAEIPLIVGLNGQDRPLLTVGVRWRMP